MNRNKWIGWSLLILLLVVGGALVLSVVYPRQSKPLFFFNRANGELIQVQGSDVQVLHKNRKSPGNYFIPFFENRIICDYINSEDVRIGMSQYSYMSFIRNSFDGYDLEYHYFQLSNNKNVDSIILDSFRKNALDGYNKNKSNKNNILADHYLIPVQDQSLVGAIKSLERSDYDAAMYTLQQYLKSYPKDLFGRLMELDLYSLQKQDEKLAESVRQFKADFPSNGKDLVDYALVYHELNLKAIESKKNGTLIPISPMIDGKLDPDNKSILNPDDIKEVLNLRNGVPNFFLPNATLLFETKNPGVPNFLLIQTLAKTTRIQSDFLLMKGQVKEAEEIMFGLMRFGTGLVGSSRSLIGRLVGIAVSAITCAQYERIYLSGFQDPYLLAQAFEGYSMLYQEYYDATYQKHMEFHPASGWAVSLEISYRVPESMTRANLSLCLYANLYTAISVRHYQLKHKSSPTNHGELINQPARDPFSEQGNPLKIISTPEEVVVYSIGPDLLDQEARITYDPTNGSISEGDVLLRVPLKPKYPFPQHSVSYSTREELLTQYPNGLPDDPFSDKRGMSYVISDTTPPIVWSFGPDADLGQHQLEQGVPQPNPFPTFGTARLPDGTWMKLINAPDEPVYDPTNGAVSNGNIYLQW
ncbi:MAG: hypothetical protein SFY68_07320 [Candidatus Sumerlaeia bacterium]|nr:hypothetical protein [Candidatus Sumerlaeia bacterium]